MKWCSTATLLMAAAAAEATTFTPIQWQQRVPAGPMEGHRKHRNWVRDLDQNFVDDDIDAMAPDDRADAFIQLSECLSPEQVRSALESYGILSTGGRIRLNGRRVSFVIVEKALVSKLQNLPGHYAVAGVELIRPMYPTLDISTRSIRVRDSVTYDFENVQDAYPALDGSGVNIAILDTGVDDDGPGSSGVTHDAFTGRFVAGFSAPNWSDGDMNGVDDSCEGGPGICEPADGSTNPDDANGHGTHVAGIALGGAVAGGGCRDADDGSTPNNGMGVAPGAGLVDVQWTTGSVGSSADVAVCLEWIGGGIGTPPPGGWAQVVNMSLGNNIMADGSDTLTRLINALTADGTAFAVAMGNGGGNCVGDVAVSPLAISVASADDQITVDRDDDTISAFSTYGPSAGFACGSPFDEGRAKPDLAAPGGGSDSVSPHMCTNVGDGTGICSADSGTASGYIAFPGTSMASPHVAGALAILLELDPTLPPGAMKDLLKMSSYENPIKTAAGAYCAADNPRYNEYWGYGLLDVYQAVLLREEGVADVSFTACAGPHPDYPTQRRCVLEGGVASYANATDIVLGASPVEGEPNTITIMVENRSGADANHVVVSCGVYHYTAGMGLHDSYDVGSRIINLAALASAAVTFDWVPEEGDHQCAIASIDYGLDTDYTNNYTQRNLNIAPSASPAMQKFRIQNPTGERANILLQIQQQGGHQWGFELNVPTQFQMEPFECAVEAEITMYPPPGTPIGATQRFDIRALAMTPTHPEPMEIGGVVVETIIVAPGLDRAYSVGRHNQEGRINVKLKPAGVPDSDSRRQVQEVLAIFKVLVQPVNGELTPEVVRITTTNNGPVPPYSVALLDGAGNGYGKQLQILFAEPLADQERYKFQFLGMEDLDGDPLTGDSDFDLRVLAGDANDSGIVTGADISLVRGQINQHVAFGNSSRADVNRSGVVTGADVSFTRARIGHSAP